MTCSFRKMYFSNSCNFLFKPNIVTKFAAPMAWTLLHKICTFGLKICYICRDVEFFLRGCFLAHPVYSFHPDYGDWDWALTLSDNLWNLIYLVIVAHCDSVEFVGSVQINLSTCIVACVRKVRRLMWAGMLVSLNTSLKRLSQVSWFKLHRCVCSTACILWP